MGIGAVYKQTANRIINYLVQEQVKYRVVAPYLGMSVLDLGCGSGEFLIPFLQEGASYIGIDARHDAISRLRSRHPQYVCYCLDLDRDALPDSLTNVPFSSIVPLSVIEHLKNPDFLLDQCQRLMNDNTSLIIATPTAMGDLVSRAVWKVWGNPKEPHPHVRSYSYDDLMSLGKSHGLVCRYYRRLCWHRQLQLAIYTKPQAPILDEEQT